MELSCSIQCEKTSWAAGEAATVSITMKNTSKKKIAVKTIPSFYIDGLKYWGPVDLEEGHIILPANARSIISLESGSSITISRDISRIRWGRGVLSIWPHSDFRTVVPPGIHRLCLDIEVPESDNPGKGGTVHSNEIEVTVAG